MRITQQLSTLGLALGCLLGSALANAVEPHAVVFMYHRFDDARYPSTNISMDQFTRQLDYLEENGYRVWPVERIVEHLQSDREIPDRTVALTVDDAYRSVYENAFPVLKERELPFTVFVSTDAVDRGSREYMSWEQMRRMQATGLVRFANHSATHEHLTVRRSGESTKAWKDRVAQDLLRARRRLEEELGAKAGPDLRLLAYPFGEYSDELADLAEKLGFTAFGQHSGAVGSLSDSRALPRFPIAEAFADMDEFAVKAASLPLPVTRQSPWNPVSEDHRPVLEFSVAGADARLQQLACYASGQGRIPVKEDEPGVFTVQAKKPLGRGRSRYNCTAPHERENRYYWFSQLWLIGPPTEER